MTVVNSLYLHVPFCRHLCNYCDFYKMRFDRPHEQLTSFQDQLSASWKRHESILLENDSSLGELKTFYLGGGTPSLWGEAGVEFLSQRLTSFAPSHEATLEIDPGAWTPAELDKWEEFGINRFSVGTQSFDPHFLKILDRAHDLQQVEELLVALKGKNFSVDFLIGSPESGRERDVIAELEKLLSFGPKHVSLYILQPSAGYVHKHLIPDSDLVAQEYLRVSEFLRSKGFHHYEVSNFGKPGFESQHNLQYWRGKSVAALGPTGTGYLALNEEKALRYKWKTSRAEVEIEWLGTSELKIEKLYLRLRLDEGFLASDVLPTHVAEFEGVLEDWRARNMVEKNNALWRMKPEAWVILDTLIGEVFSAIKTF